MSSEHSRVEGSEGLVVEPEDDVGRLLPGRGDDAAGEARRAALQRLHSGRGG